MLSQEFEAEASRRTPGIAWGDWRIGDLADALVATARELSPSVPVTRVTITPPAPTFVVPHLVLEVEGRAEVALLRGLTDEIADLEVPLDGFDSDVTFQALTSHALLLVRARDRVMRRLGSLDEWLRFLECSSAEDAAAQLVSLSRHLDGSWSSCTTPPLVRSPTSC